MKGKNMLVKECLIAKKTVSGQNIAKAGIRFFLVELIGDTASAGTLEYFWKVKREIRLTNPPEFTKEENVTDYLILPL